MEFGIVYWITALILVVGYIAVEIHRGLSRRHGTVVCVHPNDLPMAGLLGCQMDVTLDSGQQVRATATGCALCQSSFEQGTRVWVVKEKDRWVIDRAQSGDCRKA